ncbi:MAG: YdcH family protein [Cypionkella sp.]
MPSSSHAHALQSKHEGLEARLREELSRPAPDAGTIQELKKAKLRIKEELSGA